MAITGYTTSYNVAPSIQGGSAVLTTDAGSNATLTFIVPFASTPAVMIMDGSSGGEVISLLDAYQSAISSRFNAWARPNSTIRVSWIAIGIRQ
jgi:hypothetical protein